MLLLILLLQSFSLPHDVALATFNIDQVDGLLSLNVKIDKEDLEKIHSGESKKALDLTKEGDFIQQFIDENFYLVANEQKVDFSVDLISQNDYFYHIILSSQNIFEENISHLQLKNTCLIDAIDGHSNLINFNLNGKSRSFRMHQGRKRIEVKY